MFNKLYLKMALYFLSVIITTLVAVTILFYISVGKTLARDIHALLRNHTRYLERLVADTLDNGQSMETLSQFLNRFSGSYGFDIALFDIDRHVIFLSEHLNGKSVPLSDDMFERINRNGMFIQKGHFGKPVIYVIPVRLKKNGLLYLYITKGFPELKQQWEFLSGLALIGLLLALAVYPLSRGITRPVTELTRALETISKGSFDDAPECLRNDEIGRLVRGYRAMSRSVNQMIQSKKQLMADVSHELCSPLARIRVGTELIKESVVDGKTRRYLLAIENDIGSMDHLIGNLAMVSQMDLPGFPLTRRPINPEDLVGHIADQYGPVATKTSIEISCCVMPDLPEIHGDFERLKQVFTNLVDNAIRYSEHHGIITIGAVGEGNQVCFFVEDHGPGVPESDTERIFEPLYRVDTSRNQSTGGAGLGLAIARKIMNLHGGTMEYRRENGVTRFTFCLEKR